MVRLARLVEHLDTVKYPLSNSLIQAERQLKTARSSH